MKEEIWKVIPGFDGKYEVSNFGRVKSFCRKEPAILKPYNGVISPLGSVTRLVYKAFIDPNLEYEYLIFTKDGNPLNYSYDNLRKVSRTELKLRNARNRAQKYRAIKPQSKEDSWNSDYPQDMILYI